MAFLSNNKCCCQIKNRCVIVFFMDTSKMKYPKIAEAMQILLDKNGRIIVDVARLLGTNATSVSQWMTGNRFVTDPKMLEKIAYECGKPLGWLISESNTSNETLKLSEKSFGFSRPGNNDYRTIPVISMAQAGDSGFWEDAYAVGHGMERLTCPPHITDPHAFAFRVEGDSMVPRYFPGEVVVVDTTKDPVNHDDVVVRLTDGRVMVKRLRKTNGTVLLESYNQAHETIIVSASEIERCYKIVCRM